MHDIVQVFIATDTEQYDRCGECRQRIEWDSESQGWVHSHRHDLHMIRHARAKRGDFYTFACRACRFIVTIDSKDYWHAA